LASLVWPGYAYAFRDANARFRPDTYRQTPATTPAAAAPHAKETA
jgi:hypothetical protein